MTRLESRSAPGLGILVLALFGASLLVAPAQASADTGSKVATIPLSSPNAQPLGEFGTSVAASGGVVVVGAPTETVGGHETAGRAYVFNAETGALMMTLTSPDPQTGGEFGYSVAASGGVIVVAAPLEDADGVSGAGNVYTFSVYTGTLMSTLTSPNPQTNAGFGTAVAVFDDRVVVGALGETVDGLSAAGQAYLFVATTGVLISILTSPNVQRAGGFGVAVAISEDLVAVGAWSETVDGVIVAGRAYTFSPTTGAFVAALVSPNLQSVGEFGFSVAVSGNTVAVGAWSETVGTTAVAGRVYTFNGRTGALTRTFQSPLVETDAEFGFSVALSGGTLLVGARGETASGDESAGAAFAFNSSTGSLERVATSPNAQPDGEFGFSVAIGENALVAGALFETADGYPSAGHAYIFALAS